MEFLEDKLKFCQSFLGSCELSRDGRNAAFKCPFCGKANSDKKKLVIRITDDTVHCWVCDFKSRSLIPLLKKVAPERLKEYADRFYKGPTKNIASAETKPQLRLPDDFKLLPLAIRDPDVRAAFSFLKKRGLSEDDIWRHRLGVSNEKRWYRRVIFPSFDINGELNFFTGRAIDKDRLPKYDTPPVDKLPIIFNEIFVDWSKEVVLCEGPFDATKCGDNAIPLLGSSLSEESYLFEKIVLNRTPVALALDADMLLTKTPRIAKKLQEYTIPVRIVKVDTDPGDMSKEEFLRALERAETPTWANMLSQKLNNAMNVSLSI